MDISPDAIQAGLCIARTLASYTPVSVFVCPVLDITGMAVGAYAGKQAQDAQNDWQNSVSANLQTIQSSVGAIQGSMALIGLGTVAGAALSAVNLYQLLKLREDVKQTRLAVHHGFISLKVALKDHGEEVIKRIDEVAKDVEFQNHKTILFKAYGDFKHAQNWLQNALSLPDVNARNAAMAGVQGMLYTSLAAYDNPHLLKGTCCAGQLRRQECVWAIDQAITTTFQFQGAYDVVSKRVSDLKDKIRKDILSIIDSCKTEDELDFLFPEITRIHNHDLAVLESWQNHVDWIQTLSPKERQLLASSDIPTTESSNNDSAPAVAAEPEEQLVYENLKLKSHYLSLRDQLKFLFKPDLRRCHESYISQQASASGLKALAPLSWQEIPDLTVANLYWYFKEAKA